MNRLVLVRHAETDYNQQGMWAGRKDAVLTSKGEIEAKEVGRKIKEISPQSEWEVFTSPLKRTQKTAALAIEAGGLSVKALKNSPEIIERDYGDFTGMNKWEVRDQVGEQKFKEIRRSFNYPIPNGESLKEVYKRVVPWYSEQVLPLLKNGEDVLVVAHGNSLRALVKYLEGMSDEAIADFEFETAKPRSYIWKNNTGDLVLEKS